MALWGASDADEAKPKWLTTAEKKTVYATSAGWVHEAWNADMGNDNTDAQVEVLACVGGLAVKIGAATITSVDLVTTEWKVDEGGTLTTLVRWNEAVDVVEVGSGLKMNVENDSRANLTLRYASGTGTNELTFTLVIGAANSAIQAGDVLSIPEEDLVKAGATSVKDAATSTVSEIAITAAQGIAAGTVTATAS